MRASALPRLAKLPMARQNVQCDAPVAVAAAHPPRKLTIAPTRLRCSSAATFSNGGTCNKPTSLSGNSRTAWKKT